MPSANMISTVPPPVAISGSWPSARRIGARQHQQAKEAADHRAVEKPQAPDPTAFRQPSGPIGLRRNHHGAHHQADPDQEERQVRRDRDAVVVGQLLGRHATAHHRVDRGHHQKTGPGEHDRPGPQGALDVLAQRQIGAARRGGQSHRERAPLNGCRTMPRGHRAGKRSRRGGARSLQAVGGFGQDLELGSGEVTAEQAEAAVGRGEQALRVDVVERRAQPVAHLLDLLDPAPRDRDHAKNDLLAGEALEQGEIALPVRVLDRHRIDRDLIEHSRKIEYAAFGAFG
jgi:hypothetical protein